MAFAGIGVSQVRAGRGSWAGLRFGGVLVAEVLTVAESAVREEGDGV